MESAVMQSVEVMGFVVGLVQIFKELIKKYVPESWQKLALTVAAGACGALVNGTLYGFGGEIVTEGVFLGLFASGLFGAAKDIAKANAAK